MAFTTSGQEKERALFLQPRSPHGVYNGEMATQSTQSTEAYWHSRDSGFIRQTQELYRCHGSQMSIINRHTPVVRNSVK